MRKGLTLLLLLLIAVSFSGCGIGHTIRMEPAYAPDLEKTIATSKDITRWVDSYKAAVEEAKCYGDKPDDTKCQALQGGRNRILDAIQFEIDNNYYKYKNSINAANGYVGIFSDLASIGLTSAASVIGDVDTKTILSTAATGVTGGSSSISKQVFNQQSVLSVISMMDANRARKSAQMSARRSESLQRYSLQQGLIDLRDYFDQGTLLAGLQSIHAQAAVISSPEQLQKEREAATQAAKKVQPSTDSTASANPPAPAGAPVPPSAAKAQ